MYPSAKANATGRVLPVQAAFHWAVQAHARWAVARWAALVARSAASVVRAIGRALLTVHPVAVQDDPTSACSLTMVRFVFAFPPHYNLICLNLPPIAYSTVKVR